MRVLEIDTRRKHDVQRFVGFPMELYRDCDQWVPPLMSGMEAVLSRDRHPFYRHSAAAFFIAQNGNRTLGRIAVMDNRNYNTYRGTRLAFFGYFETVEDPEVACGLFDAGFAWARNRGLNAMSGPRGLLGVDGGGVLVEGFEYRPAMGVPYNYSYYDQMIRCAGFEKETDYFSAYRKGGTRLPSRFHQAADRVKVRRGMWVKSFRTKREMRAWVPRIAEAHRAAFAQAHTYYPPTEEELAMIVDTLFFVAEPKLIKLVMKGDEIIGFLLAYRDLSVALQRSKGRLWPAGWLYLLRERRRSRWLDVNGLGVLPAHRGLGANAILYTELEKTVRTLSFEHLDLVQVEEDNRASMLEHRALGVEWRKTHRGYRRDL